MSTDLPVEIPNKPCAVGLMTDHEPTFATVNDRIVIMPTLSDTVGVPTFVGGGDAAGMSAASKAKRDDSSLDV